MSKVFSRVLLVCVMAVAATGCSKNTPQNVAETWITAFHHMDADAALKLSTPATKNLINTLRSLSGEIPDSVQQQLNTITVTVKKVTEDGNKAVAIYTTSDNTIDRQLNMVRQSDKWLVAFTKDDLAKEMARPEDNAPLPEVSEEAGETVTPDSDSE
jgi:hypothetical protein